MHMAKCVTEKYEVAKSTLAEMLKEPTNIALSTDIWTSIATQAYITVAAHFISPDWELNTSAYNYSEPFFANVIGITLRSTTHTERHTYINSCEVSCSCGLMCHDTSIQPPAPYAHIQ